MARLPGLRPIDEERRRSGGGQNRGRVRTPSADNIRVQGLSPSASPVDTYARPEQAPIGSNGWESLAKSLASIQPSINNFLNVQGQERQDDDVTAVRQAFLQKSPDEVRKAIKEGAVPGLTSLAGRELAGERLAYDRSLQLMSAYQTDFDRQTGDVDAFVRDRIKDDLAEFGDDKVLMGAYSKQIAAFTEKLRNQSVDDRAQFVQDTRQGDVFERWSAKSTFNRAEGMAPVDVAAGMFGEFTKNQELLRIPFQKQQEMMLQLADQAATRGDYDLAKSILQHQRSDGPYKGSLMTDAKVGDTATKLFARIDADQMKDRMAADAAADEENLYSEGVKAAEAGAILGIGDAQVRDKNGELKTVSADSQKKEVANRLITKASEEAAYREKDPEKRPLLARRLEKEKFVGSGLEHPVWFKAMNGAPGQISLNAATGEIPPSAKDAYDTYQDLYKDSPQYLAKFLNKDALEFFEAARLAEEAGNAGTPEGALRIAHAVTQDPNQMDEGLKLKYESIDSAVNSAVSSSTTWGEWVFGKQTAGNQNYVRSEVIRLAKQYALLGKDNDEAIEQAKETFQKNHINVAGSYIKNDKRLPGDFEPLVNQYLSEFVEKHKGDLNYDIDDLTIGQSNGTGGYYIVRKSDRMPAAPESNDIYFSLNTLNDLRKRNRDQKIDEVTTKQNAR
ncbi:hypothetical protein SAMN02927900_04755 [Rhizobium mongolense subsp. loessense]|uniref:Uncharacterized protein n=1 Tax=Rhizobium mongolense subsp. loessense TaxID=158890 RepID=A0A1G4T6Y4_9HYPH|nr:hypothetical protein [Rhizobium mongolense]SCW77036.1 hypothetical protein SAMN02927900_04755 [Rhizobium mongolense subsp. loessense]